MELNKVPHGTKGPAELKIYAGSKILILFLLTYMRCHLSKTSFL